ncbi:hypothetical protein SAMN04488527_13923 [Aliiroseovarius crassostreae]|nr:hypothetical protein SAMN04488527_13923 [Aliiroseovarius crassostreae]
MMEDTIAKLSNYIAARVKRLVRNYGGQIGKGFMQIRPEDGLMPC